MSIYRVQVLLPDQKYYPAYRATKPAEAIQSAIARFPEGVDFKVVAELQRVTDDWGVDYSKEED